MKDMAKEIKIPFFNEIHEDWEEYKKAQPYPFKNKLAEGMAFMSFATGWLASAIRFKIKEEDLK